MDASAVPFTSGRQGPRVPQWHLPAPAPEHTEIQILNSGDTKQGTLIFPNMCLCSEAWPLGGKAFCTENDVCQNFWFHHFPRNAFTGEHWP